jgi:hypothetical protein
MSTIEGNHHNTPAARPVVGSQSHPSASAQRAFAMRAAQNSQNVRPGNLPTWSRSFPKPRMVGGDTVDGSLRVRVSRGSWVAFYSSLCFRFRRDLTSGFGVLRKCTGTRPRPLLAHLTQIAAVNRRVAKQHVHLRALRPGNLSRLRGRIPARQSRARKRISKIVVTGRQRPEPSRLRC